MSKILTFGEILMRLSPPNNLKMRQTTQLDFFFGGTELNVGVSLAIFGENVKHVSAIPYDFVGDCALANISSYGIDTNAIQRVDYPIGQYIMEAGSGFRPSQISYNRLNAAFANIISDSIDWNTSLNDVKHFHWTGITPGISENAYRALRDGLNIAQKKGITISTDPTYRSNLWRYGRKAHDVLNELVGLSTIFIGGVNEINEILGTSYAHSNEDFEKASKTLIKAYPSIKKVFDKSRIGVNASWQKIWGRAWTGSKVIISEGLELTHLVDRIGAGDAFAAGVIHGLDKYDDQKTLEFAIAACAIKHSVHGDANLVSKQEILDLVNGSTGARIKR